MKNSKLWKDVKCTYEMECEKIWNEMWKDMKWSVNWIVKTLWNEMKWIVNWVWKDMKWSVNWCEMKSSVWNRVWMDVNGYEWVWKDMNWISVRDSHWISQCEPNSSMRRFSKLRQRGTQLADLIRITRKVTKFSKCCSTPKANALAGSAAVRQLPSVNYCKALECLENGRQTWSHSSACKENKKTGLIIFFPKSDQNPCTNEGIWAAGFQQQQFHANCNVRQKFCRWCWYELTLYQWSPSESSRKHFVQYSWSSWPWNHSEEHCRERGLSLKSKEGKKIGVTADRCVAVDM